MNRHRAQRFSLRFSILLAVAFALSAVIPSPARAQADAKPAAPQPSPTLEGQWVGTLGGKLHILITFTKSADGSYTGTLNSLDQNSILNIESATLQDRNVDFVVKSIDGEYRGRINSRGDELHGDWTQSAAPTPQRLELLRKREPTPGAARATSASSDQSKPAEPKIPTPKPFTAPLDISTPSAPWAFQAAGKWHLVYELHLTNFDRFDCEITRLEVLPLGSNAPSTAAAAKPLLTLAGADLTAILVQPGHRNPPDLASIPPGSLAVAFLWITLDQPTDIPPALQHRISMRIGDYPEAIQTETPPLEIIRSPVPVVAPPLRGADWVAANGPSNTSPHRRALIPVGGRAYISQRFATDWVEINADGETHTGDPADNKNYRAYGNEIHAVADGIITEIKDGLPQNRPGENSRAVPVTLETVGGNHIIEQIGDSLFAFYAHLQPGSLRVKVGDRVHQGDVIGLVGNSGNSTEPHLHFDICDRSSMLACEGLPFAFTTYQLEGHGQDFDPKHAGAPVMHENDLPVEFDVVHFPD